MLARRQQTQLEALGLEAVTPSAVPREGAQGATLTALGERFLCKCSAYCEANSEYYFSSSWVFFCKSRNLLFLSVSGNSY